MKSSLKLFVRTLTLTVLSFCFYSAQAQTVIQSETFDLAWTSPTPTGWTSNRAATNANAWHRNDFLTNWTFNTIGSPAGTGATSTTYYARFHSYGITNGTASTLISPTWNLSAEVANIVQLKFYYINPTGTDNLVVALSANGGTTYTNVGSTLTTAGAWTLQTISVAATYLTANFKIRFTATSDYGNDDIGVDQVQIVSTSTANCSGTPTGGTATSVTSACSGVNFTVSNTGQSTGTGITYIWQSGPSNTGPWTNIGTASATYTALTTNQTTAKYYRLLTTCTNSTIATGSTPVLVNMGGNCTCLPYTIIVPTYTADEDIGNVTVGALSNTTTCAQTGTGPASSLNLFSNYAGSGVTVPNLQQGSSTSFSLTSITCGGNYGNGFQIYIDWNQNGNFNDVGERMYSMATAVTGPHTETGTFTVPLTATLGSTRMRVVCVETTFPDATNYASTGYLWGETEDYCVNITAASPCSGTPTSTAVASVATMCAGNTSNLSLTGLFGTGISYQWQSGTSATGPWSNITGATGGTYTTPTLSSTSYFRCNVTCSGSGITNPSSVATVTVTPAPAGATLSNPLFAGIIDCTGYSNTMSNAAGACIGNDLAVGLNQASDDIFYLFNLSNANNFNAIVNMSHCGTALDTYIHLLNSGGALISENDDNGVLCTGTASSLQATLAPGFYYVVSEGYGTVSGSINTQIQIAPITGAGSIAGLTTVCLPSTNTYTVSGLTNITGAIWTVPAGATIVSGQGTTSISVSFPSGAASGNITCVPYNGPCSSATLTLAIATSTPVGDPTVSPVGQWNVYSYNAGDATGGSGAWTNNYAGYYSISNLSFDTQPGQTNSTAQSWVNTASPSSAAGYLGCAVQADNHSYIFKRTGVPTCGTYRIDALNHDDMAILYVNGAEVWRHSGCCDVHIGVWTGYLDASSVLEYRISEGGGGSNAGLAFTQIATTATLTGTNPPSCLVNGTITISNVTGGACNLLSTGFGSLPSSTAVSGSAAITGEECVITTAANSLTGAWGYTPLIRPNAFGLIYNQFIGTGTGADGMSFSYGPFAYNTGGGETGWNTGLVVSFDTYNNPTGTVNSRIYLSYNGVEFASNTLGAFNLRTGTYIPVSINVNQAGQLTLVVNGVTIFNNTAVPAAYLTANKSTWNFAFSARTGGLNDAHKVDNVNLYADNYYEYSIDGSNWQTSTTFSAPVGTYNVQARPICGTSCATTLGAVTLSSATLDWANTQYPASGEICYGGAFDVYGQVYEPGVTPGAGAQGAGIAAEVGVFTLNTNPSTWPTTAWSSATFNSGGGGANNDEYMANIGSSLAAGTYYYAFRYSLGGCAYQYGGYSASGGGFWDGTTYSSGQLIVRQVVPVVTVTTPIGCNGGTADISVTGAGGVAPYVGETTATLVAGTYTYTLTDVNGCVGTTSYTVTEPALLVASVSGNNVLCNGGTTSVTVTATGGTAPYSGTGVFTVSAGTYSYTVTDANGCTSTASITITEPTTLTTSSVVGTGIICNGGSTTVTVSANGGNAPYVGTGTFTALAGSASYTVTDANGCSSITSITISEPTAIVVSYTATNISCTGGSAVVTISATGGTGTLLGTGSFVVNAGTYVYTVTDANGCAESIGVVISEPSIMNATASATNISCYGGASTVTVAATGGTGPYTGAGNFTVSAGTHNYTVTDANGCTASASVTITQPSQLVATSTSTPILCNGGTSTITVAATGGTTSYGGIGTFTVTAGTHSYAVGDANGCSATTSITVTEPTVLTASSSSTSISCNGGTATVTVTGNGGTGPYTGTGNFTVSAGTYSYTVTDANGCTATTSITVTEPTLFTASITSTPILCNGGTSVITVSATGGTGTYIGTGNYTVTAGTHAYTVYDGNLSNILCITSISTTITEPSALTASSSATSISCNGGTATVTVTGNGGTGPYTGTGNFTVSAGTYSYTVTDANGCTATTSITVTEPTLLTASSSSTSISCNGGTATVTVTSAGGTGPYTGTGNFTVSAGTYSYTVTDANGCTATTSITVTEPTLLTASSSSTSISCNGGTATVTVTGNGGTGPYIGTGNFTVSAGTHNYTVTDANGCTATTSITVTEPTLLTAGSTSTSISCTGGTATVTVTSAGGTGPYTGTGNFTVSAGTHNYTVTDANGCTATTSITVTEPTVLTASSSSTSISCNGGTATVTVTSAGGTGPYTGTGSYSVVAGTYSYTITDANGCSASTSITVTQPTALTASISSTPVLCNGGNSIITVSASGGTGPYTGTGNYTVTAGPHSYTVTDTNGCTTSTSTTITEPSALTASSSATNISCYGGTAVVTVTATGGTTPYAGIGTYTVSAGTHSYTVTDVNGCTSNTSINVTEPALVNAPTGAASQTFCSTLNATIASIQVTGTSVQWYASNTGGSALASTTLLVTGTTYYATQTITGCESPSYLAVTVTIPVASTYYADADGDGYGNAAVSQLACVQPTGYLLNNTDCDDAVATTYPGAPELCNSVDDNCSGFVDEGCPSTIAGEEPFNSLSAPSAMYSYCNSFYSTLAGAFPSTLAQSTCVTGEDRWYNFTTLSTGVTIFIGSNANDIVIELQDANGNLIDVENSVVGIGTEVLTRTGLTVGATYRVGVRNYNSAAQAGGQFSGCIRHLRAGGSDSGTSASWPSTIGMCNVFKAAYCGGTGVQYRYTWTGLTGIAAGQVYTKTQTSDYLTISSVTPMLPAGCMYNVLVTAIYTIPNGAGTNEVFEMPAATPTTITISANPLTSLRTSDQCASGPRYRGAVVASLPWVCGVTNWRWRFTEVNPLNLQTVGLPIEQNRGAASNYITLTNVTALQYGKTYAVQTSPIYTYTGTNYQWGPVTYMCIIGSAGMVVDATQGASQDSEKDVAQGASQDLPQDLASHLSENLELNVFPNPTHGDGLTLSLSGITSDNVQVKIYDALGRKIESKRYVVDGTLQTTLNFKNELSNGLYILEVTNEDVRRSVRFMVEQ